MKLSLSISPCPNDTFMFDAIINGRIETEGLKFDVCFADIEELNSGVSDTSRSTMPDISKVSYAVIPRIKDNYAVLHSGSALGRGNGPLLVSSDEDATLEDYEMHIAIPGIQTTANLLLERLYPRLTKKQVYLFSEITDVVARGECDAGVLIHESRFVYHRHGLYLLADLGLEWEKRTELPLPLGAIVVNRDLPNDIKLKIERVLRRSVEYALENPEESISFVRSHAQEMEDDVMKSHIALFVNEHSIDIGDEGKAAVEKLLAIKSSDIFLK